MKFLFVLARTANLKKLEGFTELDLEKLILLNSNLNSNKIE